MIEDLVVRHDEGIRPLGNTLGNRTRKPMYNAVDARGKGSRRFKSNDSDVFNINDYKLAG
jgi:hypothetical protein